jgi:hypothetical protein
MKLDTTIIEYSYPSYVETIDEEQRQLERRRCNEDKELRESRELTKNTLFKCLGKYIKE